MRTWSFVLGGALSLAAAAVLVALSFAVPSTFAGNATSTPIPCGTSAVAELPTCTPVRIARTATPTFTVTVEPSSTPVPPTQEPTKAPPTATQPAGGSGGQTIAPPSTGSGPGSGARYNGYMLLAAGFVAAMGGGSLIVAARRRR